MAEALIQSNLVCWLCGKSKIISSCGRTAIDASFLLIADLSFLSQKNMQTSNPRLQKIKKEKERRSNSFLAAMK